jgi:nitrite reductase/ring-hydroxylating ferredoxin subunit
VNLFRSLFRGTTQISNATETRDTTAAAPAETPATPAVSGFVTVGTPSDFPSGIGRMVVVGRRHVAIFRLDDGLHAIDNLCLHQAGPLCEGEIEDDVVTCPWHGWSYDIRTGVLVQDGKIGVSRHHVQVVDNLVQVKLAD